MLADCTAHSAAEPRLKLLYDLPLLLLPAVAQPLAALLPYGCGTLLAGAALPILQEYAVISVYRQCQQCGERSNAASRKQSAAKQTSLAPHDSKARLISVTTCRRFMAKPCTPHPHCAARAALQAANPQWRGQGAAPLAFSWGSKGAILSRERMAPFPVSPTGVGEMFHHLQVVNQRPQHCLYFFPLPQGQGSLRPIFWTLRGCFFTRAVAAQVVATMPSATRSRLTSPSRLDAGGEDAAHRLVLNGGDHVLEHRRGIPACRRRWALSARRRAGGCPDAARSWRRCGPSSIRRPRAAAPRARARA